MTLTLSAFESAQRNLEQQLLEHLREMDPLRSRFNALHGELVELRTAGLRADEYNFAQIQQLSKEFEAFAGASLTHRTAARDAVRCEAALGTLYEGAWLRPPCARSTRSARRSIAAGRRRPSVVTLRGFSGLAVQTARACRWSSLHAGWLRLKSSAPRADAWPMRSSAGSRRTWRTWRG